MENGTKMAPIVMTVGDRELGRIEPKELLNVLVIEDEEKVRNGIENELSAFGFSVDAVEYPQDAAMKIRPGKYDMVIVDINYPKPNVPGDEFVRNNIDILSNSIRVAFTANETYIKKANLPLFTKVIEKGGLGNELGDYAQSIYGQLQNAFVTRARRDVLGRHSETAQTDEWLDARNTILSELDKLPNENEQFLHFGGQEFSPKELKSEILDEKSSIGNSHIRMMLRWKQWKNNRLSNRS